MNPIHGGNIYTPEIQGRGHILDFSANISPLGMPRGVIKAARRALSRCAAYPDPCCRELRAALAQHYHVDAGNIVCGNGAADIIYRIVNALRPRKALITAPSFSEYGKALREAGCAVETHFLPAPRFELSPAFLPALHPEADMIFLCNPNNPTGSLIEPPLLRKIAAYCKDTGITLVLDECFNGFLDEPDAHSLVSSLNNSQQLIILKAFTKLYAMAGLRLGCCLCGSNDIARRIAGAGQAWPVSGIAQTAGIAALKEKRYVDKLRRLIKHERGKMRGALCALGFESVCGEANYLFFRIGDSGGFNPDTFFSAMLNQGILLRDCSNFCGLDNRCYRAAIRTAKENQALLKALQKIRNR